MDLKGSKTEKNLMEAFKGESAARNKYTFYAKEARKEGCNVIADVFEETAHNEMAHAKIWLKLLNGGEMPNTLDNLKDAYSGENYEWTDMYKEFSETAKEEGFEKIAFLLNEVGKIEKKHDERYKLLYDLLNSGKIFKKDEKVEWRCQNCGYIFEGEIAPVNCPVCNHPRAFFEIVLEDF